MKKLLSLIALLIVFVLFTTACGFSLKEQYDNLFGDTDTDTQPDDSDDTQPDDHTHVFGEWEEIAIPTCSGEGKFERKCECGAIDSYTVAPLKHDMVDSICTGCGRGYSEGLEFSDRSSDTAYVVGIGSCTDTDIIIPPVTPDGKTVTNVARNAFTGNADVTRFHIPATVTSIYGGAFANCPKLIAITVDPANESYYSVDGNLYVSIINYLEQYAIGKTNTSFVISDGVSSINEAAFLGSENLLEVTLPDSIEVFDSTDLAVCINLVNVHVSDSHPTLYSEGGVVYSKDKKTLIKYCMARKAEIFILPECVEIVDDFAFCGAKYLKKVTLPAGLTKLGTSAFYECAVLSEINIPEGITEIPSLAFASCTALKSIKLPDSLVSIGEYAFSSCEALAELDLNRVQTVGDNAFALCKGLKKIDFGTSLTELGQYSFTSCDGLVSIVLHDGITIIGFSAFYSCRNLETVIIPESVTKFYSSSFPGEKLSAIYYLGNAEQWDAINSLSAYSKIVVYTYSESAPAEEGNFWRYYEGAPFSWEYLEPWNDNKFIFESNGDSSCTLVGVDLINHPDVVIPSTSPDGEKVTAIGKDAFKKQNLIVSIVIPDSVVTIGRSAFSSMSALKQVTIGKGVKVIEGFAFSSCDNLASIIIPDNVESIGSYAISGCDGLKSVSLGSGITVIAENMFYGNLKLTSVIISSSTVSIEKSAFGYCSKLTDVYYDGTVDQWSLISIAEDNAPLSAATIHASFCDNN